MLYESTCPLINPPTRVHGTICPLCGHFMYVWGHSVSHTEKKPTFSSFSISDSFKSVSDLAFLTGANVCPALGEDAT